MLIILSSALKRAGFQGFWAKNFKKSASGSAVAEDKTKFSEISYSKKYHEER